MSTRKEWPRRAFHVLATAVLLVGVGSTVALAHATFYTFPYYPLDTYTGTNDHYHRQWANPSSPWDYFARFDSRVRQTTLGSFDWLAFYTGHGRNLASNGWLGTLEVYGPSGQIWEYGGWWCLSVTAYSVVFPEPFVWNPGHQGYWYQQNGAGGQCFSAYITSDKMAVTAVR